MRCELVLQINRQLHLHRTYFLPAGAGRIACSFRTNRTQFVKVIVLTLL